MHQGLLRCIIPVTCKVAPGLVILGWDTGLRSERCRTRPLLLGAFGPELVCDKEQQRTAAEGRQLRFECYVSILRDKSVLGGCIIYSTPSSGFRCRAGD